MEKNSNSNIDMVNHPTHYQSANGLEVIDVIEAFTEGLNGCEATNTGNILKYICRWKKKNGIEDLRKAEWYLKRLIEHVENSSEDENEEEYGEEALEIHVQKGHRKVEIDDNDGIVGRALIIKFDMLSDAMKALDFFKETFALYDCMTVNDMLKYFGLPVRYVYDIYGWKNRDLRCEDIGVFLDEKYEIIFPEPKEL